jgi:ABC-type dipeptide/oligopeptide/nickel transport system ATPase component
VLVVLAFNLVGDGLRDALDPACDRSRRAARSADGDLRTWFHTDAGTARAVDGSRSHVDAGEVLGIVGESGCGKSVTSLSIMRLVPEPPGEIVAGSSVRSAIEELLARPMREMRAGARQRHRMIFQEPMTSLNPVFRWASRSPRSVRLHRGVSRAAARARAVELLRLVGIPDPPSARTTTRTSSRADSGSVS